MTVSREEGEMRAAVEAWGRAKWPGCRVMHELRVGGCRADLAFVTLDHIALVEIKSSKDTLDRLAEQLRQYFRAAPEVWIAIAPKWTGHLSDFDYRTGVIVVANGEVSEIISKSTNWEQRRSAKIEPLCIPDRLRLLLRPELLAILRRREVPFKSRIYAHNAAAMIALKLTGEQLIYEVCRELRARKTGWAADEPIQGIAA